MGKFVPDAAMDAILDYYAASTLQSVLSDVTTPVDLSNTLADVAMAAGDFTKAEGDAGAGSRKLTMSAKSDVAVSADGSPLHVVLSESGTIRLVTTCTGPDLTTGSNVNFPAWEYEIGIPT